jgi:hypothetical protein
MKDTSTIRAAEAITEINKTDEKRAKEWAAGVARLSDRGRCIEAFASTAEGRALRRAAQDEWDAGLAELAAMGFTPPKSIDDWMHLARVVLSEDRALSGKYTMGDVEDFAKAFVERERVKSLAAGAAPASPVAPKDKRDESGRSGRPPLTQPQIAERRAVLSRWKIAKASGTKKSAFIRSDAAGDKLDAAMTWQRSQQGIRPPARKKTLRKKTPSSAI